LSDEGEFHEYQITPRWFDFDIAGHVTDSAYPMYFGEARGRLLAERVGPFTEFPCVLMHVSIDYRREIAFPSAELLVRTRITEIGRSSMNFEQELVRDDGVTAAMATSVVAAFDLEKRASREISEQDRRRLLGEVAAA
jgi:YbgC/YbaW family acyl-CoA thioester hydrolase